MRFDWCFFEIRCKDTMNKLYFANFFAKKCKKMHFSDFPASYSRKIAKLHNNVASTISNK